MRFRYKGNTCQRGLIEYVCILTLAAADIKADDFGALHASVAAEVVSAYRSTSSGLLDTRPGATQTLNWHLSLGEYGYLEGYAWAISAFHNMQRESHRVLFYDTEGAIRYGFGVPLAEGMMLSTSAGPYFDLPFGYRNAHMKCWGPYVVQRLASPWLSLYWKGLWLVEPARRGRVAFGIEKKVALSDRLALTPFAETVWMDKRRFGRRYGSEPEKADMLGGSFAYTFIGVKAKWAIGEDLSIVATAAMCDVINNQARKAVRHSNAYYAKNDWPVVRLGIEYFF